MRDFKSVYLFIKIQLFPSSIKIYPRAIIIINVSFFRIADHIVSIELLIHGFPARGTFLLSSILSSIYSTLILLQWFELYNDYCIRDHGAEHLQKNYPDISIQTIFSDYQFPVKILYLKIYPAQTDRRFT